MSSEASGETAAGVQPASRVRNTIRNADPLGGSAAMIREAIAGILFTPYTYLLIVSLVFVGGYIAIGSPPEPVTFLLHGPLIWLSVAVLIGLLTAICMLLFMLVSGLGWRDLFSTESLSILFSTESLRVMLRGFGWGLLLGVAAPSLIWIAAWVAVIVLVFRSFLGSVLVMSFLALVAIVATILATNGVNGWVILLVCTLGLGVTLGGAAWANQYGSGFTGGIPVFVIVLLCLLVIGLVGTIGAILLGVIGLLVPGIGYVVLSIVFGFSSDPLSVASWNDLLVGALVAGGCLLAAGGGLLVGGLSLLKWGR